jgi:starch synthase (maltosyl-transferring)
VGENVVWIAANLDPFEAHEAELHLPMREFGLTSEDRLHVHELITDQRQLWRGPTHTIRLDPRQQPVAIFHVTPFVRKPFADPCY